MTMRTRSACIVSLVTLVMVVVNFGLAPQRAAGDEWVKAQPAARVWVVTSRYEWQWRWTDTSHWELWWGWLWVSSGYWDYYWDWYAGGLAWADNAYLWDCDYGTYSYWEDWGDQVYYFCCWTEVWGGRTVWWWWAAAYWKAWYQVWYWVDTSHWEYLPHWVWVGSGYWEQYLAWVPSGYWSEPLHGTVTLAKSPTYVFTKWHFLTEDGRKHGETDEPAHVDLALTWATDRPITSIAEYADVKRHDDVGTTERIEIANRVLDTPTASGSLETAAEYSHAGLAAHYFVLTAQDGSSATVYCDIPINGFTGINLSNAGTQLRPDVFTRSVRDTGAVTF